eukprot:RCo015333
MSSELCNNLSSVSDNGGSCSALNPTLVLPVPMEHPDQQTPTTTSTSYPRALSYQLPASSTYLTCPLPSSQRDPSSGHATTHRSAASVDSMPDDPKPASRVASLPLRLVFVVVLCLFAVGPAVALWIISWRSGQDALNGVQGLAMSSVEGVSVQLQESLITSVRSTLQTFVERDEIAIDEALNHVNARGVLETNGTNVLGIASALEPMLEVTFSILRRSTWMFTFNITVLADIREESGVSQSIVQAWYNISTLYQKNVPNLFTATLFAYNSLNGTYATACLANTTTGRSSQCYMGADFPYRTSYTADLPDQPMCQWDNTVSFMYLVGIPDATLSCWIPFVDRNALFIIETTANVYTISSLLL